MSHWDKYTSPMPTSEPFGTALLLATAGALMTASVLFSRASQRIGVPIALLFLLIGMLAGSEGIGGIAFDDYRFAFRLGSLALALILFDGGLNTPLAALRRTWAPASVLATVGVALTALAIAVPAHFWGLDWPHHIVVVATASDQQFRAMAGGGSDIAAATTAQHILFAPGAVGMSDSALRIVLRHELFHYAARAGTAADAPRWLTEGVADFVGRPDAPPPGAKQAAELARIPTDADLATEGATRTMAYDRAWWFTRFLAARYGTETLRKLYERACGHGHPDVETAVSQTLGANLDEVLAEWRTWLSG